MAAPFPLGAQQSQHEAGLPNDWSQQRQSDYQETLRSSGEQSERRQQNLRNLMQDQERKRQEQAREWAERDLRRTGNLLHPPRDEDAYDSFSNWSPVSPEETQRMNAQEREELEQQRMILQMLQNQELLREQDAADQLERQRQMLSDPAAFFISISGKDASEFPQRTPRQIESQKEIIEIIDSLPRLYDVVPPEPYIRLPNGMVVYNESYVQAQMGIQNNNPSALQNAGSMQLAGGNIGGILPPAMSPWQETRQQIIDNAVVPVIRNQGARYAEYELKIKLDEVRNPLSREEWFERDLRRRLVEEDRKNGFLPPAED